MFKIAGKIPVSHNSFFPVSITPHQNGVFDTPGSGNDGSLIFTSLIWCVSVIAADWSVTLIKTKNHKNGNNARVNNRVQFAVGGTIIKLINSYGCCITVTDELLGRLPYLYALLANEGHPFCHPAGCKNFVSNFPLFVCYVRLLMDRGVFHFDEKRIETLGSYMMKNHQFSKAYFKDEGIAGTHEAGTGNTYLGSSAYDKVWTPRFQFGSAIAGQMADAGVLDSMKNHGKLEPLHGYSWEGLLQMLVYGRYKNDAGDWRNCPPDVFRLIRSLSGDEIVIAENSKERVKKEMAGKSFIFGQLQKSYEPTEVIPAKTSKYVESHPEESAGMHILPAIGCCMILCRYLYFYVIQSNSGRAEVITEGTVAYNNVSTRFTQHCTMTRGPKRHLFDPTRPPGERHDDKPGLPIYISAISASARRERASAEEKQKTLDSEQRATELAEAYLMNSDTDEDNNDDDDDEEKKNAPNATAEQSTEKAKLKPPSKNELVKGQKSKRSKVTKKAKATKATATKETKDLTNKEVATWLRTDWDRLDAKDVEGRRDYSAKFRGVMQAVARKGPSHLSVIKEALKMQRAANDQKFPCVTKQSSKTNNFCWAALQENLAHRKMTEHFGYEYACTSDGTSFTCTLRGGGHSPTPRKRGPRRTEEVVVAAKAAGEDKSEMASKATKSRKRSRSISTATAGTKGSKNASTSDSKKRPVDGRASADAPGANKKNKITVDSDSPDEDDEIVARTLEGIFPVKK
jgi:hypothetical protein